MQQAPLDSSNFDDFGAVWILAPISIILDELWGTNGRTNGGGVEFDYKISWTILYNLFHGVVFLRFKLYMTLQNMLEHVIIEWAL